MFWVLLFVLIGCGTPGASPASVTPATSAPASVADAPVAASKGEATREHAIAECGAVVQAPRTFQVVPTSRKFAHLGLSEVDGAIVTVSCLRKRQTGPGLLAAHARWVLEERSKDESRFKVTGMGAIELGGRPALAVDVDMGAVGGQAMIVFTERAQLHAWVEYRTAAPSWQADAPRRERLLQSLEIRDPLADQGPTRWWRPEVEADERTLAKARAAFRTKVKASRPAAFDGKPAPEPPRETFERVSVKGPVGRLQAYVTPDPKDGKKHPVVVWAHGGFGGIGSWFWDSAPRSNDQSARAFRDAGIVLAVGSWRAENDNPGRYELYYGEVDDYLALRDHVAKLPYVDPARIYLAGHSSGGTLVLLASELSDRFRAAFSLGGSPLFNDPETYDRYGGVPFDAKNAEEKRLRSAAPFFRSIRRPTFYFEGARSSYVGLAQWMADEATKTDVPFQAFTALMADHFTIVAPVTELIAQKILADTGSATNISFTQAEIDELPIAR
jgi:pimeloyl-ACP methyl ester carboxylesterase